MRRFLILAAAVGITAAALAGGLASRTRAQDATPSALASPAAGSPAASPVARLARAAETFRTTDGAWEVRVTAIELHSTVTGTVAKGIFVVVLLEVTNTSQLRDRFPYNALVITDAAGNAYTWDEETTMDLQMENLGIFPGSPLAPGETVHGGVAFDVPVDATGLTLSGPGWPAPLAVGP